MMLLCFLLVQVALVFGLEVPKHDQYNGHRVYRTIPTRPQHMRFYSALEDRLPIDVDFWTEPSKLQRPVDIQVSPEHSVVLENALNDLKIPHHVIHENLQKSIEEHLFENARIRQNKKANYEFDNYLPLEEYMAQVMTKVDDCNNRADRSCEAIDIGQSYEGETMYVIKITNGVDDDKPRLWIDSGIHAREWVAFSTGLYLLTGFIDDDDAEVNGFLDAYDLYMLPAMNPDGYRFTFDSNRMWRKSRSANEGSSCIGTDINRNFDHQWGTVGISRNPCSETYCGSDPYSEVEAENVANFIEPESEKYKLFLTLHSYGQLWMAPWGYTTDAPNNYEELMIAGNQAVSRLTAVHGTPYTVGSASEILYSSSGTSRDWAYGVPEIEYVYTIELRDTGNYGFLLPPDQILATGQETWEGVRGLISRMIEADKGKAM